MTTDAIIWLVIYAVAFIAIIIAFDYVFNRDQW